MCRGELQERKERDPGRRSRVSKAWYKRKKSEGSSRRPGQESSTYTLCTRPAPGSPSIPVTLRDSARRSVTVTGACRQAFLDAYQRTFGARSSTVLPAASPSISPNTTAPFLVDVNCTEAETILPRRMRCSVRDRLRDSFILGRDDQHWPDVTGRVMVRSQCARTIHATAIGMIAAGAIR